MHATESRTYTVQRSRERIDREYPWLVLDPDGELMDQFATALEAEQCAAELELEDEAEAKAERLLSLRDAISVALDDCEDEAVLTAALALLTR